MNTTTRNIRAMMAAAGLVLCAAACGESGHGTTASVPAGPAAVAKTPDLYPTDICIVTGEKLGGMGEVVKYDYKGREIRFCCQGCIAKVVADPEKYLKILDDAAAAKKAQ